ATASCPPARVIMPKPRAPSRLLKKLPRGCGPARARQADRSGHARGVGCRRGPDRAEEQAHPALGQARLATLGAVRSPPRLNLVFRSYGDILEHCCFACNNLVHQPWTIMSIGLRDWAHRF